MKNTFIFSLTLALGIFGVASLEIAQAQTKPKKSSLPLSRPVAVTGIVSGPPQNGQINLRANGQIWRIKVASQAALAKVRGGDELRAFGRPLGTTVYHAQIRVLRSRASTNPDDYMSRR
jgi:hypothetical protein